jgi:hypothetical protein
MTSTPDLVDTQDRAQDEPREPWNVGTAVLFRFAVVYFGLFCLTFAQILFVYTGVFGAWLPDQAVIVQMILAEPVLSWAGRHVFGIDAVLHLDSGSGDQAIIWLLVFCLLVVAAVATIVWTALDRRRTDYDRLNAWFLTFLRLCLAGQMVFYGLAKVIPTQMPAPPLAALLRPFGDLSPASVLWLQVGSSPTYEIALGAAELSAGLLLFLPRTATLGALLSLASMGQVFLLNMTYDVPVKILSFHLLLISIVLLVPQARRLANVFVLQRTAEPMTQPQLFTSGRANRTASVVQAVLGVWVLAGCVLLNWHGWYEYGGGRPKPDLYGIWSVTEFTRDDQPVPPLSTDMNRWQRVVFDVPGVVTYQRMNGELVDALGTVDGPTLTLTGQDQPSPAPFATLDAERPSPDLLRLDGQIDGRPVTMSLSRVDLQEFTLHNRGFHWVQEYPYFR